SRSLIGKARLEDLLTIEGINLWEVCSPVIIMHHLIFITRYTDLINTVFRIENPKRVILDGPDSLFSRIFETIARSNNIEVSFLSGPGWRHKIRRSYRLYVWPVLRGAISWARIMRSAASIGPSRAPEKGRTVFLTTSRWQSKLILPVLKALRERRKDGFSVIFSMKNPEMAEVKRRGLSCRFFREYLNLDVFRRIRRTQALHKRLWRTVTGDEGSLKAVQYKNINIWDFIKPVLEYLLFNPVNPASWSVELAREAFDRERPGMVVYSDFIDIFSRYMILLARDNKILILMIQYGVTGPGGGSWKFCLADKIAVSGEYFKNVFEKIGFLPEQSIITGQPRFDGLIKGKFSISGMRAGLGLPNGKRIILFTSTVYSKSHPSENEGMLTKKEYQIWLREIYRACNGLEGAYIVVKPHHHPRDPASMHDQIIRELDMSAKARVVSIYANTTDLIKASTIMITWESTTALEAIALGKPVVIVNLTGRPDFVPYVQRGAAIGAYKKEDILPALQRALDDKETQDRMMASQRQFSADWLYKVDGKASERIAELIMDLNKD
ncbi:CDP-glycerol glycerophosphotransferase family protein, partial [Candidatus Omnitrophota bacterium]